MKDLTSKILVHWLPPDYDLSGPRMYEDEIQGCLFDNMKDAEAFAHTLTELEAIAPETCTVISGSRDIRFSDVHPRWIGACLKRGVLGGIDDER